MRFTDNTAVTGGEMDNISVLGTLFLCVCFCKPCVTLFRYDVPASDDVVKGHTSHDVIDFDLFGDLAQSGDDIQSARPVEEFLDFRTEQNKGLFTFPKFRELSKVPDDLRSLLFPGLRHREKMETVESDRPRSSMMYTNMKMVPELGDELLYTAKTEVPELHGLVNKFNIKGRASVRDFSNTYDNGDQGMDHFQHTLHGTPPSNSHQMPTDPPSQPPSGDQPPIHGSVKTILETFPQGVFGSVRGSEYFHENCHFPSIPLLSGVGGMPGMWSAASVIHRELCSLLNRLNIRATFPFRIGRGPIPQLLTRNSNTKSAQVEPGRSVEDGSSRDSEPSPGWQGRDFGGGSSKSDEMDQVTKPVTLFGPSTVQSSMYIPFHDWEFGATLPVDLETSTFKNYITANADSLGKDMVNFTDQVLGLTSNSSFENETGTVESSRISGAVHSITRHKFSSVETLLLLFCSLAIVLGFANLIVLAVHIFRNRHCHSFRPSFLCRVYRRLRPNYFRKKSSPLLRSPFLGFSLCNQSSEPNSRISTLALSSTSNTLSTPWIVADSSTLQLPSNMNSYPTTWTAIGDKHYENSIDATTNNSMKNYDYFTNKLYSNVTADDSCFSSAISTICQKIQDGGAVTEDGNFHNNCFNDLESVQSDFVFGKSYDEATINDNARNGLNAAPRLEDPVDPGVYAPGAADLPSVPRLVTFRPWKRFFGVTNTNYCFNMKP